MKTSYFGVEVSVDNTLTIDMKDWGGSSPTATLRLPTAALPLAVYDVLVERAEAVREASRKNYEAEQAWRALPRGQRPVHWARTPVPISAMPITEICKAVLHSATRPDIASIRAALDVLEADGWVRSDGGKFSAESLQNTAIDQERGREAHAAKRMVLALREVYKGALTLANGEDEEKLDAHHGWVRLSPDALLCILKATYHGSITDLEEKLR